MDRLTVLRSTWHRVLVAAALNLTVAGIALAQFSPGELSRAHMALEGSMNCTKCHDLGKEIAGDKCLGCHREIVSSRNGRHGLHFAVAAQACVVCHKEHVGRDARTVRFDSTKFDHAQSGFRLAGKHATVQCVRCHNSGNIRDSIVNSIQRTAPHATYLGLKTTCASCHTDPHEPRVRVDCATCHAVEGWRPVRTFNHGNTRFPLLGKHAEAACAKCHAGFASPERAGTISFATKQFVDCTPCHTSPHKTSMGDSPCSSCHDPRGWKMVASNGFNHDKTSFPLAGMHRTVKCERCHGGATGSGTARNLHPLHGQCADCHRDVHAGVFKTTYKNDCAACHTVNGFRPSTYSMTAHANARFPLSGSHRAVLCERCHRPDSGKRSVFRFENFRCTNCHADYHNGQFKTVIMKSGCEGCHTTEEWKSATFDHSSTGFSIAGKHRGVACSQCHLRGQPLAVTESAGLVRTCENCHSDVHQAQFAGIETDRGKTLCSRCHRESGWHELKFDHQTQSKFVLTGAHKNVPCAKCHPDSPGLPPNPSAGTANRRYKPLDMRCESCHATPVNR